MRIIGIHCQVFFMPESVRHLTPKSRKHAIIAVRQKAVELLDTRRRISTGWSVIKGYTFLYIIDDDSSCMNLL